MLLAALDSPSIGTYEEIFAYMAKLERVQQEQAVRLFRISWDVMLCYFF